MPLGAGAGQFALTVAGPARDQVAGVFRGSDRSLHDADVGKALPDIRFRLKADIRDDFNVQLQ